MRTLVVISSAMFQRILMPEISDTASVQGRQPWMILSVSFSSLPDMSQTSAGSFLSLLLYFSFSPPLQSSSSVRTLPPQFIMVPHLEASFRATPALRHWLTYRAQFNFCVFSMAVCAVLCRPLCCYRICAHPLLSGLFI